MSGQTHLEKETSYRAPGNGWTRFARIVTNVTVPPFLAIPTYIVLGSYDQERIGSSYNLFISLIIAITFSFTVPVITVLVLRSQQKVSDVHITIREQRTVPFLITIVSYIIGSGLLWLVSGPSRLAATMLCYTTISIAIMLINFYWKISVHAAGVGGPLAALTLTIGWVAVPFFILIPLVDWARVYLKAHTVGQVVAGSFLGYFATLLQILLLFRPVGWF